MTEQKKTQRIAKIIAAAGVCSRRQAEVLIAENRVQVNGEHITTPATLLDGSEIILVDGERVRQPKQKPTRLWIFHKPKGTIVTERDPQGRPTIFNKLPTTMPRVVSVGRLDFNTEGLLLLTNKGDVARELELPSSGWKRTYRVRIQGILQPHEQKLLERGLTIEGVRYKPITVRQEAQTSNRKEAANSWLVMTLTEGKNREIRKVLEHFNHPVNRLIRVAYGPYQLGELPVGAVVEVDPPASS